MAAPPPETGYGVPVALEPLVTRILAPNPSPYTYHGTQTYLVGTSDLVVIDPGPDDRAHLAATSAAIGDRRVRAILVTHHHRDHSPASRPLAAATGAPIVGAEPKVAGVERGGDAAFDADYDPDRVLRDGDTLAGDGWSLHAIATPGHTANHLAFALPEAQAGAGALFSGDHVMGWSTSVVSPPDGDMGDYMASLAKLLGRSERIYYPGHGEAIGDPQRLVRGMLGHRRQREGQIQRTLREGPATLAGMTPRFYAGIDPRLMPAAERSVLAHLIDLERRDLVAREGDRWRTR